MLVFFALGNAKVLSFALGDAKVPNANGVASQWNIGFSYRQYSFNKFIRSAKYSEPENEHNPSAPPPPPLTYGFRPTTLWVAKLIRRALTIINI